MKKHLIPIALMMFAAPLSMNAQQSYSIDECVGMACRHYPQAQEYGLIDEALKYDISNAGLGWVPQLSISAKATWQSEVVEMPIEIPGYDFDFNIPHDQYGVTADLTQPLWDGGMSSSKKALAQAGAEVKKSQLTVNLYSIRGQVQKICLGILLTDKQIELSRLLEENLLRNMDEVSSLIAHGMARQSDMDQVEVNLLSCRQQLSSLDTERKSYLKILELLTGNDMSNAEIHADCTAGGRYGGGYDSAAGGNFSGSSDSAAGGNFSGSSVSAAGGNYNGRPELALYAAQAKQIEAQRKQLNSNISPKFNLTLQGGYGRPGMNMLSGEFSPYFVAGIRMQWNFGALYTLKNDRRKVDADARKVEYSTESFKLNNSVEAEQKRCEIDKAQSVLADDDRIIELRQSIRESGESQYREGVLKMNDYLSMLDDEHKARLNKSVHEVQLLMAEYDLKNTLGE